MSEGRRSSLLERLRTYFVDMAALVADSKPDERDLWLALAWDIDNYLAPSIEQVELDGMPALPARDPP